MRVKIYKFNPFHDGNGHFSSGNGFKSFSANPYTKAGQMAMQRAATGEYLKRGWKAGKNTQNVHANSKTSSKTGQAHTVSENIQYLRGKRILIVGNKMQSIGGTAAQSKLSRAAMNEPYLNSSAKKPAAATAQPKTQVSAKPQTQQAQAQQNVTNSPNKTLTSADYSKMSQAQLNAIQQKNSQDGTRANQVVYQGKDIRSQVEQLPDINWHQPGKTHDEILKERYNEICDMQNFHELPAVTTDMASFAQAVNNSGNIMYRAKGHDTWLDAYADAPRFTESGDGGTAYDVGTYFAANRAGAGNTPSGVQQQNASRNSFGYGPRQISATTTKDFKVSTETSLYHEMMRLPGNIASKKYGNDVGLYAAAKGIDAHVANSGNKGSTEYLVVHNRSKVIVNKHTNNRTGKLENTYSSRNMKTVR